MTATLSGADAIVRSLAGCGVKACFANPGTSEMHLVTALDRVPRIRSVLCLFEGVATGAADGYARVAGVPAMTLLHLGPGYTNGAANIHNARRAYSPMINLIGDHATTHRAFDAPLASDIAGLAGPNSQWMGVAETAGEAGTAAVEAFVRSHGPPRGPVSLIVPADAAWTEGGSIAPPRAVPALASPNAEAVEAVARAIRSAVRPVLLAGGNAFSGDGLHACARLSTAGVRILSETFTAKQSRGGGRFEPERLPYFAEAAVDCLSGTDLLVLAGAKRPVAFFAYPGKPGDLAANCGQVVSLGGPDVDASTALSLLADVLGAQRAGQSSAGAASTQQADPGAFNAHVVGAVLARRLPEGAVIVDDGVTSGLPVYLATAGAAAHDWLGHTGGAIGQGMPMAVGAAIACPDRRIVCLAGDGAGMYTVQALWTMAREKQDITTLVFVNNAYRILRIELARTGAGAPGPAASALLSLGDPEIDWPGLAKAMGVAAESVRSSGELAGALDRSFKEPGPRLIACHVS